MYGGDKTEAVHVGVVVIPASGRRNVGSGARGGGDTFPLPTEHHRPVYCDSSDTGAMSGRGTAAGITGVTIVVVAGRYRHRPR